MYVNISAPAALLYLVGSVRFIHASTLALSLGKPLRQSSSHLVISDSKKIHSTKEIVNNVKNFKEQNEERFSILCNEESKLIRNIGEAFSSDNLEPVGKAMSLNQKFLEEISVSNDQLQKMIRIADQTSYGSKITGAGNGGCIISLVDKSNLEKTLSNMKKENFECFSVTINPNGLDTF